MNQPLQVLECFSSRSSFERSWLACFFYLFVRLTCVDLSYIFRTLMNVELTNQGEAF